MPFVSSAVKSERIRSSWYHFRDHRSLQSSCCDGMYRDNSRRCFFLWKFDETPISAKFGLVFQHCFCEIMNAFILTKKIKSLTFKRRVKDAYLASPKYRVIVSSKNLSLSRIKNPFNPSSHLTQPLDDSFMSILWRSRKKSCWAGENCVGGFCSSCTTSAVMAVGTDDALNWVMSILLSNGFVVQTLQARKKLLADEIILWDQKSRTWIDQVKVAIPMQELSRLVTSIWIVFL